MPCCAVLQVDDGPGNWPLAGRPGGSGCQTSQHGANFDLARVVSVLAPTGARDQQLSLSLSSSLSLCLSLFLLWLAALQAEPEPLPKPMFEGNEGNKTEFCRTDAAFQALVTEREVLPEASCSVWLI